MSSNNGGLFKGGSIFGGNKTPTSMRPSTSGGSPTIRSESTHISTTSRTSGFSRKTSLSTSKSSKISHRRHNNSTAIPSLSPGKHQNSLSTQHVDTHSLPIRGPQNSESQPISANNFGQIAASAQVVKSPGTDSFTSTTPYSNMIVKPGTGYQAVGANGPPSFANIQPPSPTLESITFQQIQETSSKRISTLEYLRKA